MTLPDYTAKQCLYINTRLLKKFAGLVVAEMIRQGASATTMRENDIPKWVYYNILGGGADYLTVKMAADKYLKSFAERYLY